MDSIVLIVILVALVAVLAVAGVVIVRRRRSERLQEQFGPEYERTVTATGDRKAAESELAERERRHDELDIRSLRAEERDGYRREWDSVQQSFVDDPARALQRADVLVMKIMRTRGYPVNDFEQRAEDLSVAHPEVVQHYREARSVRDATDDGSVDTEKQRRALTSYRSLVEALLEHDDDSRRRAAGPDDGPHDAHRTDDPGTGSRPTTTATRGIEEQSR